MTTYFNNQLANETLKDISFMDAWILLEKHYPNVCNCSYCQDRKLEKPRLKLWLPKSKARNAWRVLCWNKNGNFYFLRSTLPTWRWFIYFNKWGKNSWRLQSMKIGKNSVRSLFSICNSSGLPTKLKYIESIFWITFKAPEINWEDDSVMVCGEDSEDSPAEPPQKKI